MCVDIAQIATEYLSASTFNTIAGVVAAAAAVTAVVPMPKTGPLSVVAALINALALNIGHAQNK